MITLTNLQRSILLSACNHELGLATRPAGLASARAAKQAAMFAEAGLAKEIRAKLGAPIWREDGEGQNYALKILKAGRDAVSADIAPVAPMDAKIVSEQASQNGPLASTAGSKSAMIVGLMQRADGATIEDLIAVTGWLPHTTRAALSGLRKKGVVIERLREEQGGASIYRITAPSMAA